MDQYLPKSKRILAYLLLILATFLWGIGGPIVKYSFSYISPFEFLFWRFLIASVVILPIFLIYLRRHPISFKSLPKLFVLALFGNIINLALAFWGLNKASVVESSIIGSLAPMFVAVGGALFLNEVLTRKKLTGISLAICGTMLAVVEPILSHESNPLDNLEGNVTLLASSLCWVAFVILSKKWESPDIKPTHIVSVSFMISVPVFFILSTIINGQAPVTIPQNQAFWGVVYMAIFSSIIAFTAYETALQYMEASDADIFSYLGPLWSIPLAIVWLGEKFDPTLILSSIFIAVGIFIAESKISLKKYLRGHHLSQHK